MDLAITIGCYFLTDFLELNLAACRKVFGTQVPLLVSDDLSIRSPAMEYLANKYGAEYLCSSYRRSHFAGDAQAFVNALAFAEANQCDVAVKISQRVILLKPTLSQTLLSPFADGTQDLAMPGKPRPYMLKAHQIMYSLFEYLTDVVAIRTDALPAEQLIEDYRKQVLEDQSKTGTFIEKLFLSYANGRFSGRTVTLPELTNHIPGEPFAYLRKCQNDQRHYVEAAASFGLSGAFNLDDWRKIDPHYQPRPVVV